MRRPIVVPEVGIAAALLSIWYARPGESVCAGERIVELLMGTATFDVAAPCSGRFVEKSAWPLEPVTVGQVLGFIEEDANREA
jgi:pyruvate/2-oxoglutarate dehydrogenase complex dihydrolipoamide acyltransferase (E2) component